MEMEQRVGRVHRFGSRRTILVDTVVAAGTREARAYEVARHRLQLIASALGHQDRFEALFARVMTLIPPQELQEAMLGTPSYQVDQERIGSLVQEGFSAWQTFHEQFTQQGRLGALEPGLATWDDLRDYVIRRLDARLLPGFRTHRFAWDDDHRELVAEEVPAAVLELEPGSAHLCEEAYGLPVVGPDERVALPLGTNSPRVNTLLRSDAFPDLSAGAAWLRWREDRFAEVPVGVLVAHRQSYQHAGSLVEGPAGLHAWLIDAQGARPVERSRLRELILALGQAHLRREADPDVALAGALRDVERSVVRELAIPSETDRRERVFHAVTPVFAAVVVP